MCVCSANKHLFSNHTYSIQHMWIVNITMKKGVLGISMVFLTIIMVLLEFENVVVAQENEATVLAVPVGVVLDLDSWVGKMGLSCINMSLSDFYASHPSYRTRIGLHVRDSKGDDMIGTASAALDLMKNVEVQAVIGPEYSMQANFILGLGEKAHVPIISFTTTSQSLTSLHNPYFIQASQSDLPQVYAITAIVQAFRWREVVLIYANNGYGMGIIPTLGYAFQDIDIRIAYRSAISPLATDDQILEEVYKLMTMQTRVFIVHMSPSLGSRLFTKAKEIGMMSEGFVWIMTNGITDQISLIDPPIVTSSIQGILGVKTYVPISRQLQNFTKRWKLKSQQDNPEIIDPTLNIFGLWAYDATWALAMAIEQSVITTNLGYQKTVASGTITDLDTIGVSPSGESLIRALANTTFKGLARSFRLVNGQLEIQSPTFEIINVNGNAARVIGYWTPKNGLVRYLTSANNSNPYHTSKSNLGGIIWPGDSTFVPRGWQIPASGKRLKILVPSKEGFTKFVKVYIDPITNETQVTGYCIDIFKAAVDRLPFPLDYEFIPFAMADCTRAGCYNDLIDQVYFQNYDGVVGDISIVANRSLYIDFTLPYTESGVSMIIPYNKDNHSKNAWVFLKPLTWDLWLAIGCSFIIIAFTVWILEHQINEEFRGAPSYQIGTSFWFSFSAMVFAQRERVLSNLTRFVVVIWMFVLLILTQSYTASLTSLLTVQQLRPSVSDVNDLIRRGDVVGYKKGSYVYEILKSMKFDDAHIMQYRSEEELDELLTRGSGNGGIAAAFDVIPYVKLFLAKYCDKYTTVAPIYKTAGFGFVFSRGSPLVAEVSRAILNVIEGPQMAEIEKKYFLKETCVDSGTSISSNRLSLASFWGLFFIAGIAAFIALTIFFVMFLKTHRPILTDSAKSLSEKIVTLKARFNQRDHGSHILWRSDFQGGTITCNHHEIDASYSMTSTSYSPSPKS